MNEQETSEGFSTSLAVTVLTRTEGAPDWQVFDHGPGVFHIPEGQETAIRIQNIGDDELEVLVEDLRTCHSLRLLNLSENRKVTDRGLTRLAALPWITGLNLSSCDLTSEGLAALTALPRLESLNLSFCNRLTDEALRQLRTLTRLSYLDLQGTPKIKQAAAKRLERRGLIIHK